MKPLTDLYTSAELFAGLREISITEGDVVFFHLCFDHLGVLQDCLSEQQEHQVLLDVLIQAVGLQGTIVIPTYTFSFCRQQLFDVDATPTDGGPWSTSAKFLEFFRRQPGVKRSRDPLHSVCALGPCASELLDNLPNTCFGRDSVHDRLHRIGGKICTIGVGLEEASFQHHVEEMIGVPFRFKKLFTGKIRENGVTRKSGWIFNVHLLAEKGMPDGHRVDHLARLTSTAHTSPVGAGEVVAIGTDRLFRLLSNALKENPWFTAVGPADDPIKIEEERVNNHTRTVTLSPNATMSEMIDAVWTLPRDIVSDGYDVALKALAGQIPMEINEYASGTECSTWIVPEKWTCHEAWLESLDGTRIFSYGDHPLHVISYSLPFEGEVSREELLNHLHVHPYLPDAVPFIFKYYERDWGLCCSRRIRDTLTDDRYRVRIRSDFSYGTLKVGEVIVPGKSQECIVLCAHLCHPHMVNDDLSGVVVGIDVMRELLRRKNLRYTYRFLIVPETIGSIAFISHYPDLIPNFKGGLFLEMLGLRNPAALQLSIMEDTEVDACFKLALKEHNPYGWVGKYRELVGNDERQFNSPGVRVPMLSLSRVLPPSAPGSPYPEYHSSFDTPQITSLHHLEDARDLVLRMLDTLETNVTPVNLYQGELFCSRFGIHIDDQKNPEGARVLFGVLDLIDGTRSIADLADACGVGFTAVRGIVDELLSHGVISIAGQSSECASNSGEQTSTSKFSAVAG